jgi:hypothetical protein
MFPVNIRDPGNGNGQRVTPNGESVTGLLSYSLPYYVKLETALQVYNVIPGQAGKVFLMTGILVATTRNIVGEIAVNIYESLSVDSGVHDKDILTMDIQKSERVYLPLVNVATQEGRYINADAEDAEVAITIFGYYVNAI